MAFLKAAMAMVLGSAAAGSQTPPPAPSLSAVRFYRSEQTQTLVTAFVAVPHAMLAPGATVTYVVTSRVKDASGLVLNESKFTGRGTRVADPRSSSLEILTFAVAPGTYTLEVDVADSVSGKTATTSTAIVGFPAAPPVSDLLLARRIRMATRDDSMPGGGEVRLGQLVVTAGSHLALSPLDAKVSYVVEAYAATADTASTVVRVRDASGKDLVTAPAKRSPVPVGGGVLTGSLDLTGLPPGEYRFITAITVGGRTTERSAGFTVTDLQAAAAANAVPDAASGPAGGGDDAYFASMEPALLDAAFEPLHYLAPSAELKVYSPSISVDARRRFLAEFWTKRDPSPGTARNEAREQFYAAIQFANANYGERGNKRKEGWTTDRGRVFIRNGKPDIVQNQLRTRSGVGYEVWRYTGGRGRYYVFIDRTDFGAYDLGGTNDVRERSTVPNWQQQVGQEALQDIGRLIGIDFVNRR